MTVPEENRPRTESTDGVLTEKDTTGAEEHDTGGTGRTVREAFEQAGVSPDDYEEQ
ncbi:hypothetical protein [Streptomyces sp. ALI-76-A]|jgi:hypothetical protein|uniref:hypothetical protein n=1 Tax=Streptomyces sp. ALI-76-A TaxID=3025736 RepID=UPI00256EA41B|nr:hypothetical protein [Streptomyces sp. ALI-76-A]MDL5205018.1 hypothetical protein [Streptomyces sp. ALI-76-A]